MSILEPPSDDDFPWALLEEELDTEPEVVDVTSMKDYDLLNLERDLVSELRERGEMLNTTTDRGREVHSLRAAARIELARRDLK